MPTLLLLLLLSCRSPPPSPSPLLGPRRPARRALGQPRRHRWPAWPWPPAVAVARLHRSLPSPRRRRRSSQPDVRRRGVRPCDPDTKTVDAARDDLEPASRSAQGAAIQFYIGVDGLNVWLVVLTALLMVSAVLVSWTAIDGARQRVLRLAAGPASRP